MGSASAMEREATVKLLKIICEQRSMVTIRPEQFEEIESAAREMFAIPDDTPVFVSTEVPTFEDEKVLIHRLAWPVICEDISTVWITTTPAPASKPIPSGAEAAT